MSLEHERYIISVADNGHIWCFGKSTQKLAMHINAPEGLTDEQILEAVDESERLLIKAGKDRKNGR